MRWVNEERLSEVLSHVRGNSNSSFYEKKYAGAPLDREHFFEFPPLTRSELASVPVLERLYVPHGEVRFAAFTSGTTSGQPLITLFSDVERYFFEPSLGMGIARPLIIYPPLNKNFAHTFLQQCRQAEVPVGPVMADFQNLKNSAMLAQALECDSLYATPTLALLFAEEARARGITGRFKLLELSSETLTASRREELRKAYPNARIANLYASSEIGQFALLPCPRMIEREENSFHVLAPALAAVELLEGELVVSYGLNKACPLIRYRTGDFMEERAEDCACGLPGPVLAWSHRADVDRLRINGVEFDAEAFDRAVASLEGLSHASYQAHFRPGEGGVSVVVEMEDQELSRDPRAPLLAERAARELAEHWRISSTANLKDAIERKLFSSLSVAFVPKLGAPGLKLRRFVMHE